MASFNILSGNMVIVICIMILKTHNSFANQNTGTTLKNVTQIEKILKSFVGKNDTIALLFGLNVILAPIVDNMHEINTHKNIHVGIITCLQIENLLKVADFSDIICAGEDGRDIRFPEKYEFLSESNSDDEDPIKHRFTSMMQDLNEALKGIGYADTSDLAVQIHADQSDPKSKEIIAKGLEIMENYGFQPDGNFVGADGGKLNTDWNRSKGVRLILRRVFEDDWFEDIKVIYAGDDEVDEDVINMLNEYNTEKHPVSLTFRISSNEKVETCADYRVDSIGMLAQALKYMAKSMA